MKKRRRCIGVVARGVENKYQKNVLQGIIKQAYALDYNVAVFALYDETDVYKEFFEGEINILNLINFDLIDGFVFPDAAFKFDFVKERILKMLVDSGKPVVCVDVKNDDLPYYMTDDRTSFDQVVSHLIESHGAEKIYCLTGIAELFQTNERLLGYKDAMERHGLYYDDSYIFEGDFWDEAAIKLANDIYSKKIEMPDAVVCHNDWMAINFCNRMTELGIRVPEDIKVAGFDGIEESRENIPTITTYETPIAEVGARACLGLYKMITGISGKSVDIEKGKMILGQSCGCNEKMNFYKNQGKSRLYKEYYRNSNMLESLMSVSSFDEFCDRLIRVTYILRNIAKYDLCLNKDWDSLENDKNYISLGYEDIVTPIARSKEERIPFRSSLMYPDMWIEKEYPSAFYFFPMHINDRCFGYSVVVYENEADSIDEVFWNWSKAIVMSLEFVRSQTCMTRLNEMIRVNSYTDNLTGIFNYSGYQYQLGILLDKFKKGQGSLLVIQCDLDDLKPINDTYGHLEGDNALRTVANALRYICMKGEICARTGGDEFTVTGVADYSDEDIHNMKLMFEDYLERYNKNSGKEYMVHASIGFKKESLSDDFDFEKNVLDADKMMYDNKAKYKGRKNIR